MCVRKWLLANVLLLAISPFAANATILYEFTADSSGRLSGDIEIGFAFFAVETADFVTTDTFIEPDDWLSCTVELVIGTASCDTHALFPNLRIDTDAVAFSITPDHPVIAGAAFAYYFDDGAFAATGSYESLFGSRNSGRLTVSRVSTPVTSGLLLLGFLALVWRRQAIRQSVRLPIRPILLSIMRR